MKDVERCNHTGESLYPRELGSNTGLTAAPYRCSRAAGANEETGNHLHRPRIGLRSEKRLDGLASQAEVCANNQAAGKPCVSWRRTASSCSL